MANKSTFELFDVLKDLDAGNLSAYEERCTSDTRKKDFDSAVGWILPQWMSASTNVRHQVKLLQRMDNIVGYWGALKDHPQLRTQLLASCGLGSVTRHRFPKGKRSVSYSALHTFLSRKYRDISENEVELWCSKNNIEDVEELANQYGIQEKELVPILKAFKKIVEDN